MTDTTRKERGRVVSGAAVALRLVAAFRAGARPVARPHGRVHLYAGPLTRTGRSVPRAARPMCGVRSRRLTLTEDRGVLDLRGRLFCRRCTASLVPSLGVAVQQLDTREDMARAYGHLTVEDLILAARWTNVRRTELLDQAFKDNHQIGTVASVVLGGPASTKPVDDVLLPIRSRLRLALRDPDEVEAAAHKRQAWDEDLRLRLAAREQDVRVDRAQRRNRRGGYLMPHERELIKTA